jgi:hypothetical protein
MLNLAEKENPYMDELKATAKKIAGRGRGILASDESNATTGKRLATVDVENTEENRRKWRELLYTAPGLGQYISGAIMFEETLFQSTKDGKPFVDVLVCIFVVCAWSLFMLIDECSRPSVYYTPPLYNSATRASSRGSRSVMCL